MAKIMKTTGIEVTLSDGTTFQLARDGKDEQAECNFEVAGHSFSVNFETGDFLMEPSKNQNIGVIRINNRELEIDLEKMSTSDPSPLGCQVTGGKCNCGSGWICPKEEL